MSNPMSQMLKIAEAIKDRDLAELASKQAYARGLALARQDLIAQANTEMTEMAPDTPYRARFELPRKAWRDARIIVLGQKQALASAAAESQRLVASKSLGRASVLQKLMDQKELAQKRKAQKSGD